MQRTLVPLALALMFAPAAGAQFVAPGATLPVVASLPGLNSTDWRTDVSVVNLGTTETTVVMLLQPEIRDGAPAFEPMQSDPIVIPAGRQHTMRNVLGTVFGLSNTKGGLSILSTDFEPLVVGARIYTLGNDGGSFGQNVEGVLVANEAWAPGVTHDDFYRTNLGIFLPIDPLPGQSMPFTVSVLDAAGDEVASGTVVFTQAGLQQRSLSAFGVGQLLEGFVHVTCQDPALTWYGYISRVDQVSGDAVFRPLRGRQGDLP